MTSAEQLSAPPDGDALALLFTRHYRELVRLAALLLDDPGHREEVVQEAFVRLHGRRLRDPEAAAAYLRQTVMNLSRSRLRRRLVAARMPVHHDVAGRSAEDLVLDRLERSELGEALRGLPRRQREAVVLRYYVGLSEAETAAAMGTGTGAAKSNTSRGVAALRSAMEPR